MDRGVPCCAADVARRVTRIKVGDHHVAILELERIIEEVHREAPPEDEGLKAALVERASVYNYIPPKAAVNYGDGLLEEYRRVHPKED